MPPCAYAVAESNSERLVSTTVSPLSEARHAVCRPATPDPTTSVRVRMRSIESEGLEERGARSEE
jgi:hypothetical protein